MANCYTSNSIPASPVSEISTGFIKRRRSYATSTNGLAFPISFVGSGLSRSWYGQRRRTQEMGRRRLNRRKSSG